MLSLFQKSSPSLPPTRRIRAFVLTGIAGAMAILSPLSMQAATWKPDPSLSSPKQRLKLYEIGRHYCETHYDDAVGLVGTDRKIIRESAYYACTLLMTGDPTDRKLAEKILRVVLTKQDLRKDKPTYGCFTVYFDTDWANYPNPDLNFGQFVGMALAEAIDIDNQQHHVLSADLRSQLDTAFKLAVDQTMRRDVDPSYTNISILSAAVAAAGDKLFKIPGAKDFALSKASWILSRAVPGMTVKEYLSPTYYGTDLYAAYELKKYADSPDLKEASKRLIDFFWRDIAAAYHAPTLQLAGPFSRTYGDNMLNYAAMVKYFIYFALDGKYPLPDVEAEHSWDCGGLGLIAALPLELRPELKKAPEAWREVMADRPSNIMLRQYRKGDFILGSVNQQSLWKQQRSVVAFWPITAPAWNVGFCMDMSTLTMKDNYARYKSVQSKSAVLAAITGKAPVPDKGGLRFGFNLGAEGQELQDGPAGAYLVKDGDVTTYIYPVTQTNGKLTTTTDKNCFYVDRSWACADAAEKFSVLSYLVVFQLPGEAAPVVKDLALKIENGAVNVSANVNGEPLTLEVNK